MWQSCRIGNKARCLAFIGEVIFAPHWQCLFMFFLSLTGEIGRAHL